MAKLLSEALSKVVRGSIGKGNKTIAEMVINWHKIVGSEIAASTTPSNIYSTKEKGLQINILYINTQSSAVALKLSYQQEIILEKIAVYFGYKVAHKIRTKVMS